MTANWYHVENEKREIEKERTQAELKNLKNQLNPHFLFNTLNSIYALIQVNPQQAQYAVHSLSHMLRYVLYENNQNFISLDKEFAFMRNYVELMSLRLASDRVHLKIDIPEDGMGYMVAPLLFITLIENAFKHGISPSEESFINISFRIAESDTLICTIENSYFPKTDNDRSGSGIGLANLRKRLNLIYPNRHILRTDRMGRSICFTAGYKSLTRMVIESLVVDDEPLARDLLAGYVKQTPFLHLAGASSSAVEASLRAATGEDRSALPRYTDAPAERSRTVAHGWRPYPCGVHYGVRAVCLGGFSRRCVGLSAQTDQLCGVSACGE